MKLRSIIIAIMLLFGCEATAKEQHDAIVVIGPSGPVTVNAATETALINQAKKLVTSSNFDSANQPDILTQPTQKEWDEVCSEPCIAILFSKPALLQTMAGSVTLSALRISLTRGNVQGKNDGELIRFGKYDGVIWVKLRAETGLSLP